MAGRGGGGLRRRCPAAGGRHAGRAAALLRGLRGAWRLGWLWRRQLAVALAVGAAAGAGAYFAGPWLAGLAAGAGGFAAALALQAGLWLRRACGIDAGAAAA